MVNERPFQPATFETEENFSKWLSENHKQKEGIWILFAKKDSDQKTISYTQALDIALTFGWIDSSIRKYDQDYYRIYFSPRNPKSNWSKVNKDNVQRLLAENKMQKPGIDMVRLAKQTGTWDALNDVEKLIIPQDLQLLFDKNSKAEKNFTSFSRSSQRGILEWIFNAKTEKTREKRIKETARLSALGLRVNFPESKGK